MTWKGKTVGFALSGSHCTFSEVMPQIDRFVEAGAEVIPIASHTLMTTDTRFGASKDWQNKLKKLTGHDIISTIVDAEPLGPSKRIDVLALAPCTGNSLSKLANAMTDSPVLMAAKAQLRNQKPLVLAISTNDALGLNAANLARLLVTKNIYFVPFGQDAPETKPNSLVARMELIMETCEAAMLGKQLQPILCEKYKYLMAE